MNATSLNIAVIPAEDVKNEAIELSQKVANEFPVHFILNSANLLPHITLYQAHFPTKNISSITDSLKLLLSKLSPPTIQLNVFALRFGTFLFWNCGKTQELQELHEKIVATANPFRNGLILPHLSSVTNMTDEDKDDIKKFGALLIGPRYYPHITITRLQNSLDGDKAMQKLGERKQTGFSVRSVVLGNLGPHGTVNGIIKTFELKGNL